MPDESPERMHLFVDESGERGRGPKASNHFILGGIAIREKNLHLVAPLLARLREATQRRVDDHMHWNKIRPHAMRLHVAQELGRQSWLRSISIVVCKRHLPDTNMTPSQQYLFSLRMLLERASWLARDSGKLETDYTLAHIKGFKLSELREYEEKLRQVSTNIAWKSLPRPGKIGRPQEIEGLQLSDLAVSAVGSAFNLDAFGNTEDRYLRELSPIIYRGPKQRGTLTSYGLKMHPWGEDTKAAYPWVAAL